jgi:hypothetical protein
LADFSDGIAAMCARSKEDGTVEGSKDFWYFDVQGDYCYRNKKKLPWEIL